MTLKVRFLCSSRMTCGWVAVVLCNKHCSATSQAAALLLQRIFLFALVFISLLELEVHFEPGEILFSECTRIHGLAVFLPPLGSCMPWGWGGVGVGGILTHYLNDRTSVTLAR